MASHLALVPIAPWVEFVNREAIELAALPNIPRSALRGHMRDRLAEAFAYPLELELRCLVVGERDAPTGPGPASVGQLTVPRSALHVLEVVPEGITRDAAALTGPFLVATTRALQPGSVLDLRLRLADPRREHYAETGLHGEVLDLDAVVPVEP